MKAKIMSMVSNLNKEEMTCYCPACGELVDVDECDFYCVMDNGDKEYYVECPDCGQSFYAAESYDDDTWEARKYAEGINTTFKVGQRVFVVKNCTMQKSIPCPACSGRGKVMLDNQRLYACPECGGAGYRVETTPKAYRITCVGEIDKVRVEVCRTSYTETYMLKDTAAFSRPAFEAGSTSLFAKEEDAEEYCRMMNEKRIKED